MCIAITSTLVIIEKKNFIFLKVKFSIRFSATVLLIYVTKEDRIFHLYMHSWALTNLIKVDGLNF